MKSADDRVLKALELRLIELGAWRNKRVSSIASVSFQAAGQEAPVPVRVGDPWPERAVPVRMHVPVTIPAAWAGETVRLELDVGGEALVRVNGAPAGGLSGPVREINVPPFSGFQRELELAAPAAGGERFDVEIEAVPRTLFGAPVYDPRVRVVRLVVPDPDVRGLYEDLVALWDAASALDPERDAAERQALIDLLREVLDGLRIPDGQTDAYLAAVQRSPRVASWLSTIWEEWDFASRGEPAGLSEDARRRVVEARKFVADELAKLRRKFPARGALLLTGHAHIDLAWLWPLDETRRKAVRTFSNVLSLMRRYPDFHFNQSTAQLYAFVEEDAPQVLEEIRERVAEGRWEPVGGTWVEMDCNVASGESLVRQHLYGQRYFQRVFGKRARVAWLPDTFGFAGTLPQILRQSGIDYFYTTKLYWNETNKFPYDLYWWEGLDGSRVLAHLQLNEYRGYNGDVRAAELLNTWRNFRGKTRHGESLFAFGWGDGGGGPTEGMLERYERIKDFPALPRLRMGRVHDFFDGIDQNQPLPVWVGEQYLEYHRGTYTTQGRIKRLNRVAEHRLYEAEAMAALAAVLKKAEYPRERFTRAWTTLLRNQFHDILPGSAIRSVYERAETELQWVIEEATAIKETYARLLAEQIPAAADDARSALVVWNLRTGARPLELEAPRPAEGTFRLLTPEGQEVPYQLTEKGVFIAAPAEQVDGVGYVALAVVPGQPAEAPQLVTVTASRLENQFLRVDVAADGTLTSVYDKVHERELLAGPSNRLVAYSDRPAEYDAWNIDEDTYDKGEDLEAVEPPRVVEAGPLRAAIEVCRRREGALIRQRYVLTATSRRLDIQTHIQWTGRRTLIKTLFDLAVRSQEATFETAYGSVTRPTHRNTPWDSARFEVPGHRWVDLSEGGYGVSLLNDGRYGYHVLGQTVGLTLLRSPIYPDPYADEGEHVFTYSLFPHANDWRQGTVQEAEALNAPLFATVTTADGTGPARDVLLAVSSPALRLGSIKLAEDDDSLVLRFYEAYGSRGSASVSGRVLEGVRRCVATNLLEDEQGPAEALAGELRVGFTPWKLTTLKLLTS